MVLLVRPGPTPIRTKKYYLPSHNTPLHSIQSIRRPKNLLTGKLISAECVRSINWDSELCSLVTCAGSPTYNFTVFGPHDMGAGIDLMSSDNFSFDRLLNGWLRDLEQWRDIHAFMHAQCRRHARVNQASASGLLLVP